jgi:hypothetical protein
MEEEQVADVRSYADLPQQLLVGIFDSLITAPVAHPAL